MSFEEKGNNHDKNHIPDRSVYISVPKLFSLRDLQLGKTIGTGTFGRVRIARYPGADRYFALKMMRKSEIIRLNQVEHIFSERAILASISHPFIVKLYSTFQDGLNLYMLMEYVNGGELFTYLRRMTKFTIPCAKFYASELVLALEYLHAKGIVYRDLKPENLLIDEKGHIKLTDFGFAKYLPNDQRTWTLCGTPEYLAPEIIQNKGHDMAVDWWALGILIYEMIVGTPPYYDTTTYKIYEKILAGELIFPKNMDEAARDLITGLLTSDPSLRLGNLINGADDIKNHAWFADIRWDRINDRALNTPYVPAVRYQGDTSNFDNYPEEDSVNPHGTLNAALLDHCFEHY